MEWQPIETAPKDGTPVLVWADCDGWRGNFARVCAAYHRGRWRIYGPVVGEPTSDGKSRQWLGEVNPIGWWPLPSPPEKIDEDAIVAEYLKREKAGHATKEGADVKAICKEVGEMFGLDWQEVHSIVIDATFAGAC